MCHQKYQNFDEKVKNFDFLKIDPELKIASKINDFKQKSDVFKTNSLHGAKHSPSSLPLDRPSADFWGPRAIAFFGPFDLTLLIDILHRSRNPWTFLQTYI